MRSLLRKGMSEMMAVVISIVITIAVGALLWSLIPSLLTKQTQLNRISVDVQASSSQSYTVVLITVKNLGQNTLHNISVEKIIVGGEEVADKECKPPSVDLEPGEEASIVCTIKNGYSVGTKVIVVVKSNKERVAAEASTFITS